MVEIQQLVDDKRWYRTLHLDYFDRGRVNKKGKTKQFDVISRTNRSVLGTIRWWAGLKSYCFFPLNLTLYTDCRLREIAQFCEERTQEALAKITKKVKKKQELRRRQKRIEKLAKKRLTNAKTCSTIYSESKKHVPAQKKQVVEGKGLEPTPLEKELGSITII